MTREDALYTALAALKTVPQNGVSQRSITVLDAPNDTKQVVFSCTVTTPLEFESPDHVIDAASAISATALALGALTPDRVQITPDSDHVIVSTTWVFAE